MYLSINIWVFGLFSFGATADEVSVNIWVYIFVWTMHFSPLSKYLHVAWLAHKISVHLFF